MGSKALTLIAASLLALQAEHAFATGIPVFCYNCQEATSNAAHAVLDGIRMQTEALLNAQDYVLRTQSGFDVAIASAQGVTEQRIKNAYAMDPSIAKPRLACSQKNTATVRAAAGGSVTQLRKALVSKTSDYNSRGANLAPGESRKEYAIKNVIDVLGDETSKPAEVLLSQSPIPNDAAAIAAHRKVKDVAINPFPIELPSEEDIKRIKSNGSQGEKEKLAQSYALNTRLITAQSITDEDEASRIQLISSESFKEQIDYMTEAMDSETRKLWLTGKLSSYQIEKLGASYRALSPRWITQMTASPSPEAVNKEIMLELAELLHQQGIANEISRKQMMLAALKEIREASQDGMTTR